PRNVRRLGGDRGRVPRRAASTPRRALVPPLLSHRWHGLPRDAREHHPARHRAQRERSMTLSILLATLVLAADPATDLAPNYANASSAAARSSNQQWWTRFADPELNDLVR